MGRTLGRFSGEEERVQNESRSIGRGIVQGVVEEVVEELLAEFFLDIVCEEVWRVLERGLPEGVCGSVAVDGVVCGGKEGGGVEAVDGGDEAGALEQVDEGLVVRVGIEEVRDGRRGGVERHLRRGGKRGERNECGETHGGKTGLRPDPRHVAARAPLRRHPARRPPRVAAAPGTSLRTTARPLTARQLHPSRDAVLVLDAHSLTLLRVLPFWLAFPDAQDTPCPISCMAVDAAMKLVRSLFLLPVLSPTLQIIAAVGTRVAAWCLSGNDKDSWRVHSTLVLPDGAAVTALASRSGLSSSPSPRCF